MSIQSIDPASRHQTLIYQYVFPYVPDCCIIYPVIHKHDKYIVNIDSAP